MVPYGPLGSATASRAAAADEGASSLEEMPESVRRLVANRSARLSGPTLELVGTAAELGPEISYSPSRRSCRDLHGGLLRALDAALASGLLVERGGGYAFAHPLYRLAVRGDIRVGATRPAPAWPSRSRSPAVVADEVLRRAPRRAASCTDAFAAAEHALTACELGAAGALRRRRRIRPRGVRARDAPVRPRCALLLERSLAAWRQLPPDQAAAFDASGAYAHLANLRMFGGDDAAARTNFHEAISAARTPEQLARAYTDSYWLPYRHGDFEGGLAILEEALARLPADATVARAMVDGWVGWTLGRLHRLDESIEHLTDAARVLGAADDRKGAMRVFDQLGIMLEMVHRSDEAIEWLERSLAIALDSGTSRVKRREPISGPP